MQKRQNMSGKKQQADRHDYHTCNQAIDGNMVFPILFSGRQELIQGDENHDTGYRSKEDAKHNVVHEGHQDEETDQSSNRFGQTGKK